MLQHYSGRLGTFDYDDNIFYIEMLDGRELYLRLKENTIDLDILYIPAGLSICTGLFNSVNFNRSVFIVFDRNTKVEGCDDMFRCCQVNGNLNIVGLSIDENDVPCNMFAGLDVSGFVNIDTDLVFNRCIGDYAFANINFSKFNAHVVFKNYLGDISGCKIPEDFFKKVSLVDVSDLSRMFEDCTFISSSMNIHLKSDTLDKIFYCAELSKKYAHIVIDTLSDNPYTVDFNEGTFREAKLPKFLDLDIEIESGEIPNIDEIVGKGGLFKFAYMFSGCSPQYIHFSERMFAQRDLYYTGMFEECNIPDYITETEPVAIMRQFNEVYDKAIVSYNSDYENCKRAIMALLKSGKSKEYIVGYLKEQYKSIDVDGIYVELSSKLATECSKNVNSLLEIPVGSEYSRYTISEVRSKLFSAGYPKEVIDDCILNYIGDQYICL